MFYKSPLIIMSNNISEKLFKELQDGCEFAYETIFKENISRVLYFTQGFVKSRAVAEELSQDVFLKLWNYREKLVAPEAVLPFLFTVARNGALDYIRKSNNHKKYLKEQVNLVNSYPDIEDELQAKQLHAYIAGVVSNMPSQRKRIFKMSRVEQLEVKEIAERLKISPKTVYAHLDAAIKDIKKEL